MNIKTMSVDEIVEELERRLDKVKKEIDFRKNDLGDPVHYHHYKGYLEAADGMFGERQFLEKLLGVQS